MPGENHCVYVREICGVGDTSYWSEALCFTTICSALNAPYSMSFDSIAGPGLPPCWYSAKGSDDTTVMVVSSTDKGQPIPRCPQCFGN
ncbi:MAG: hypothetical protein U5L96_18120 [Owenweeksia sp.]|nr:hypothetical protein [Owenweeksia sp.]